MKVCGPKVTSLGKKLARYLASNKSYGILGTQGTWMAGGCWLFAQALVNVLGDEAELRGVWSDWLSLRIDPGKPKMKTKTSKPLMHHVVVEIGDCFIDGDGAQSQDELLHKMEAIEMVPDPYLGPFDPEAAREGDILCPADKLKRLEKALHRLVT